jgi:hypothetical protein
VTRPDGWYRDPDGTGALRYRAGRDGNFAFVVTGVEHAEAVTNPEVPDIQKRARGEFVLVHMTVTNIGTRAADVLHVVQHAVRRQRSL